MMILVLLAGFVLMRESRQEPLASWEDRWVDFLATTSRQPKDEAPITLVGIDDSSLQEHPWPWSPLDFSLFFQAVIPYGPASLATDEVLDWDRFALTDSQKKKLPQYEKILLDQIRRSPQTLLGAQLGFPDDPQVAPPWQEVPLLRNVKGDTSTLPDFPIVERQPPEGYRLAATIGFTNLLRTHGRFNSAPLLFRHHGQVTPAFPLQAVMQWAHLTPDDITVHLGSHIDLGRKRRIPIDARGRVRVDFGVPRGAVSFEDLLFAPEQVAAGNPPVADLNRLKGRVVMLSRIDSKARTIPLAANRNGSPGELFAAAIATIQNASFIQPAPVWVEITVASVIGLLGLFVPSWSRFATIVTAIVLATGYMLVAMTAFHHWLLWLPGIMPAGALLCLVLFRVLTSDKPRQPKKPVIL